MFSSLKTKFTFVMTLIMALTAVVIMYFTQRDVGRAMFNAEQSSAQLDRVDLFVFDDSGTIVVHSDPDMVGTSIAELRDLKGRVVAKTMRYDELGPEGKTAVFQWARVNKNKFGKVMGHFKPINGWKWTVGAAIDFEDIEAESQKKMETIVKVLKKTFGELEIAQTGYAFLFTGDKKMLIPPPEIGDVLDSDSRKRRAVGLLIDSLMGSFRGGNESITYKDPLNDAGEIVEAYISYFKAFDWYVAVVVRVAEIQAPAKALISRQSIVGGYYQADYLPAIQRGLVTAMRGDGRFGSMAERVAAVPANTYLSGMQAVMLRQPGGRVLPAGPLEIAAAGGLSADDISRILEMSVRDAHGASLLETIPDVVPADARPPGWWERLTGAPASDREAA